MKKTLYFGQLSVLSIPQQFVSFAEAYLDSAKRLCKVLKISTRKATYERGAVVLYLTFHSVELFLKAAVLQKDSGESLNHNIGHLYLRYKNLYPGKKFNFKMPFKTNYIGFEPPSVSKTNKSLTPAYQTYRYPTDKKGNQWMAGFAFNPESFLIKIEKLADDFKRIKDEIF